MFWFENLRRSEAVDIWHAIPHGLREALMSSLELDVYVDLLEEKMSYLDWDRLYSELELLESIRDTWVGAGIDEDDLDNEDQNEDEELAHQIEHALQASVKLLWPHLLPSERRKIWASMEEVPEMTAFVRFAIDRVDEGVLLEALTSKDTDTSDPMGLMQHLWPLLQKDLRKVFLTTVFANVKPEWAPVFGEAITEAVVPRQILTDVTQMDNFEDDLICEKLWSYKDGALRLALIACRLRMQVPNFDSWIATGDHPASQFLFFISLGHVRPAVLSYIAATEVPWNQIKDRPLDGVWGALTPDERVKSFASTAFVRPDLLLQTQVLLHSADVLSAVYTDVAKRSQSFEAFLPHLWPQLDKSTRRAACVL